MRQHRRRGECYRGRRLSDAIDVFVVPTGRNDHAPDHRAARIGLRARRLQLRKAFQNLDANFLRDRAFDPAHAIPEPDDFALLLDIH